MRTSELRNAYAKKSVSQIPRLLTCLDRNKYSPTYGCFHRDYWLYKTSDFPDAVRQFGVHALALVYKFDFPANIYKGHPKVREWTIAAMLYWTKIQHGDGSFDEFYPYERGWVGPTAFTMYTMAESYLLLKDEMKEDDRVQCFEAIKKAGLFIIKGESEEDHLANHHAMAALAVWKAYEVTGLEKLKAGFEKVFNRFLDYHVPDEGWSREYDGTDPGYLSATISFLGKVYKTNPDPRILEVLKQSVEFSAYFAYPNGFYAGSAGSRNTLHFYPHGYEILGEKIPMAKSVAEKMLKGLSEDKLVPPEIMSDRYLFYRVPELLLSYLDYTYGGEELEPVPWEREEVSNYFDKAKIFTKVFGKYYLIANVGKGGVVKLFNRETGKLLVNDGGIIGLSDDGEVVTSQWINPSYNIITNDDGFEVNGALNKVPSNKLFTPLKLIIFRLVMMFTGWYPPMAHYIKGKIRKTLILGQREVPVAFKRVVHVNSNSIEIMDKLNINGKFKFKNLSFGDEFFVRYVPQSRFFQSQELDVKGEELSDEKVQKLNKDKQHQRTFMHQLK